MTPHGASTMPNSHRKWILALVIAAATIATSAPTRAADDAKPAPPPATAPTTDQAGPARFYGTISAVDAAAKTFTVDNVTYSIVPETQMTKADGDKPATVAD